MPEKTDMALGFDAVDISTEPGVKAAIRDKQQALLDEAKERFAAWMDCNNLVMEADGIIHTGNDPGRKYETFGQRLTRMFRARGVNVVALAAGMHVHPSTVYYWMNDRCRPSLSMLLRLSEASGIAVPVLLELMDGEGPDGDGKGDAT